MDIIIKLFFCVFSFILFIPARAQILVSRNFEINPLNDIIEEENRLLGNTFFGAEAGHGFFSAGNEQTWNIKYIGFLEIYRWGNTSVLGLSLAHELHANPYNDIYFNPRGALWNESLVYHRRLEKMTIQLGANHRCRHNIDNADPPRSEIFRIGYEPQSRVLVLTSLFAGFHSHPGDISTGWQYYFFGRTDAYLYTEDSRRPPDNQEGSFEAMRTSLRGGFYSRYSLSGRWQIYTRNHLNYIFFKEYANKVNYRTEAGISILGEKAKTGLFVAYEHFFDDTSRPFPFPSSVLFVGIRSFSLNFY